MIIRVRSSLGTWRVNINGERSNLTLLNLKQAIFEQYQVPIDSQSLSKDSENKFPLSPDDSTLLSLGLEHGELIFLIGKLEKKVIEKSYIGEKGEVVSAGAKFVVQNEDIQNKVEISEAKGNPEPIPESKKFDSSTDAKSLTATTKRNYTNGPDESKPPDPWSPEVRRPDPVVKSQLVSDYSDSEEGYGDNDGEGIGGVAARRGNTRISELESELLSKLDLDAVEAAVAAGVDKDDLINNMISSAILDQRQSDRRDVRQELNRQAAALAGMSTLAPAGSSLQQQHRSRDSSRDRGANGNGSGANRGGDRSISSNNRNSSSNGGTRSRDPSRGRSGSASNPRAGGRGGEDARDPGRTSGAGGRGGADRRGRNMPELEIPEDGSPRRSRFAGVTDGMTSTGSASTLLGNEEDQALQWALQDSIQQEPDGFDPKVLAELGMTPEEIAEQRRALIRLQAQKTEMNAVVNISEEKMYESKVTEDSERKYGRRSGRVYESTKELGSDEITEDFKPSTYRPPISDSEFIAPHTKPPLRPSIVGDHPYHMRPIPAESTSDIRPIPFNPRQPKGVDDDDNVSEPPSSDLLLTNPSFFASSSRSDYESWPEERSELGVGRGPSAGRGMGGRLSKAPSFRSNLRISPRNNTNIMAGRTGFMRSNTMMASQRGFNVNTNDDDTKDNEDDNDDDSQISYGPGPKLGQLGRSATVKGGSVSSVLQSRRNLFQKSRTSSRIGFQEPSSPSKTSEPYLYNPADYAHYLGNPTPAPPITSILPPNSVTLRPFSNVDRLSTASEPKQQTPPPVRNQAEPVERKGGGLLSAGAGTTVTSGYDEHSMGVGYEISRRLPQTNIILPPSRTEVLGVGSDVAAKATVPNARRGSSTSSSKGLGVGAGFGSSGSLSNSGHTGGEYGAPSVTSTRSHNSASSTQYRASSPKSTTSSKSSSSHSSSAYTGSSYFSNSTLPAELISDRKPSNDSTYHPIPRASAGADGGDGSTTRDSNARNGGTTGRNRGRGDLFGGYDALISFDEDPTVDIQLQEALKLSLLEQEREAARRLRRESDPIGENSFVSRENWSEYKRQRSGGRLAEIEEMPTRSSIQDDDAELRRAIEESLRTASAPASGPSVGSVPSSQTQSHRNEVLQPSNGGGGGGGGGGGRDETVGYGVRRHSGGGSDSRIVHAGHSSLQSTRPTGPRPAPVHRDSLEGFSEPELAYGVRRASSGGSDTDSISGSRTPPSRRTPPPPDIDESLLRMYGDIPNYRAAKPTTSTTTTGASYGQRIQSVSESSVSTNSYSTSARSTAYRPSAQSYESSGRGGAVGVNRGTTQNPHRDSNRMATRGNISNNNTNSLPAGSSTGTEEEDEEFQRAIKASLELL